MMPPAAAAASGQLSVPPGFRFHPTDEELLHYYLRKKVSYEAIDLDVIREVDLNKLEPWDLKDKCRIGSHPQDEWYFFSHKDKKYPTGTRTNRATAAGFWKATGRDKAIHLGNSKRIGMRKTLVFYIGRAPHGQKTDWIMHEYRLDDENVEIQLNHQSRIATTAAIYSAVEHEDGWVVCRVFKKKSCNTNRGFQPDHEVDHRDHEEHDHLSRMELAGVSRSMMMLPIEHNSQALSLCDNNYSLLDGSMHLPQLLSPDVVADSISAVVHNNHPHAHPHPPSFLPGPSLNGAVGDVECCNSQNLLRLTSGSGGCSGGGFVHHNEEKFSSDWTFLDKLLSSHQSFDQQSRCYSFMPQPAIAHHHHHHHHAVPSSAQKFPLPVQPFHYVGSEPEFLKFFHK